MDLMDMFRYRYEDISLYLYIKLYAPMTLVSNFEAGINFKTNLWNFSVFWQACFFDTHFEEVILN